MGRTSGKQDLAAAVLLAALALFVWFWIRSASATVVVGSGGVTFATMPSIYAAALLILSALLGVQALIRIRQGEVDSSGGAGTPERLKKVTNALRFFGTIAALLAYAALLNRLPLAPLTMVFLFGMFWLYGHRRWLPTAVVAIIGGLAVDALFIRALQLPL